MSTHRLTPLMMLLALGLAPAVQAAIVPPGVQLAAKQELVRNNGSEPESLDPALAESVPANNIVREIFEGLTATDSSGKVVPGVAESWKQTTPTTWVFKLRKDARWSNGQPVTADDFVYGLRRFLDPKTASSYAGTFGVFVANGIEASEGKKPLDSIGIKAIDKQTVEYTTPYPVPYFAELVSNSGFYPMPKAAIEQHGVNWTKPENIVSNGAYALKSWQVNNRIVLTKSDSYWDKANVQITQETFLAVPDASTDVKMYQSGENDWVYQLPPNSYTRYKTQYPKEIRNAPMLGLRYYSFNNQDPLLKDRRVRQALSMVIDRDILAQKVTADGQVPAYSALVKGVHGGLPTTYDWASWPMDKRVAEAKKLLAEAGVKPGTTVNFVYNTDEYHKQMAIFAASQWKTKLGLNTTMDNMEFKVLLKRRHDGQYQIARNGWIGDYNDATTFLTLVQCRSTQNDNKNACNDAAEKLIDQGNAQTDPKKREALLTQATKAYMEDYPMLPLLQYTVVRLVKPWVGGYTLNNPMDRWRAKDLYIIKH
ncbi:peptide ABC transporter substrate-binding protein [Amphibiibacter pelophylacis]|uniref:Peptide ABC transporter substrate-binding protein n=1 Tax=Amphibiibacter pelophylacis TaxID=1799477 RepID=A0ACC6P2P9_9BURK